MAKHEKRVLEELRKMGVFITKARGEVAAIMAAKDSAGSEKNIVHISEELQEVVRHTEEATNTIMDHADAVMAAGAEEKIDPAKLSEHAMGILEACSFQDITGQRIKKVLQIVEQLELRIDRIVDLLGGGAIESDELSTINTGKERMDEAHMSGPQKEADAISQEDVDKLFD
jgi:chemotaxis protein CheZ